MAKKKNNAFLPRLAMGVIFVIAVIYSVYHLISLFNGDDIKTIVSGETTHKVTVGGVGYVFRDEALLEAEYTGVVDYAVSDGEKIAVEQQIADVYQNGGSFSRRLIRVIDDQIALLEKSSAGSEPVDLATLRGEANDIYYKLVSLLASGEVGELDTQTEKMMITLNKISDLTSDGGFATDKIAELRALRESLLEGEYETVYALSSGYFYRTPDGYEDRFTLSAANGLTAESFATLEGAVADNSASVSDNVFGKLASTSFWKIAVPLTVKDAEGLSAEESYVLTFPENNQTELTMTLESMIADGDRVICVFYCNRTPDNFSFERCQSVKIEVSSASGIYVPRSALTRLNGVRGVYVLRGSVVHFRSVQIVYEGEDYCLVSESFEGEGGYYALDTNELIITEGKNLFDGRILN